jgi:hypothetical protein
MASNLAVLPKQQPEDPEASIRAVLARMNNTAQAIRVLATIFYDLLGSAYRHNLVKLSIAPVFIDRAPSDDMPMPVFSEDQILKFKPNRENIIEPRGEDHSQVQPPIPGGLQHPGYEGGGSSWKFRGSPLDDEE